MIVIDILSLLSTASLHLVGEKWRGVQYQPTLQQNFLRLLTRALLNKSQKKGIAWLRNLQQRLGRPSPLLDQVSFTAVSAHGVRCQWCRPRHLSKPSGTIVYIHGGGYVIGSVNGYRDILASLAIDAQTEVLGIDYRLAPEAPFPAAHHDCLAATQFAIEHAGKASRIALAGDSAGGALCLATVIALRDGGNELPAACGVISPWVDPCAVGGSLLSHANSDILNPALINHWIKTYLQNADMNNPRTRLMTAELHDLPPIYVQTAGAEILFDQIQTFAERLQQAGCDVTQDIYPDMFHVFQAFAPLIPEGRRALQQLSDFLSGHLLEQRS